MEKYLVKITQTAIDDLQSIFNYIDKKLMNHTAAVKLTNKLINKIYSLDTFPNRYPIIDFRVNGEELHKMIVKNYSIFYVVGKNIVSITDILFSKSNIFNILKLRHSQ